MGHTRGHFKRVSRVFAACTPDARAEHTGDHGQGGCAARRHCLVCTPPFNPKQHRVAWLQHLMTAPHLMVPGHVINVVSGRRDATMQQRLQNVARGALAHLPKQAVGLTNVCGGGRGEAELQPHPLLGMMPREAPWCTPRGHS